MPTFFPQHANDAATGDDTDLDSMIAGYLGAAEWLANGDNESSELDDDDRFNADGWAEKSLQAVREACEAFLSANRADLAKFCEITGRDMETAGHDFFLTSEGHGAGFWDRGAGNVGDRLSKAARGAGPGDPMCDGSHFYFASC